MRVGKVLALAHGAAGCTFVVHLDQVRSWGPSVIDFLDRNALGTP